MNRFRLAALLVPIALGGGPAHAQMDPGVFPMDMVSPVLPRMMLENAIRDPRQPSRGARLPARCAGSWRRAPPSSG